MRRLLLFLLLLPAGILTAAEQQAFRHLSFATGTVTVGSNLATIALPPDCRYLANDQARYWVEEIWGNPPDAEVIGLVVPEEVASWYDGLSSGKQSAEEESAEPERSWGMVVSWAGDTGHVEDSDARSTDFNALLTEMRESTKAANPERIKAGYGSIELLGWAEEPHYDSSTKKLYWAKSLRFNDQKEKILNYCVRILGARGVLELNAVDDQKGLPEVAAAAKAVLTRTEFTAGNRYADFKEGVDPVAAGGIAALVVGGVLAKKAGLLAIFGIFILKFIKILIIPAVLVGGWIMKRVRSG